MSRAVVPRVDGLTRWEARALLVQAGFVAKVPDGVSDDDVVRRQSPEAGMIADAGSVVVLRFHNPQRRVTVAVWLGVVVVLLFGAGAGAVWGAVSPPGVSATAGRPGYAQVVVPQVDGMLLPGAETVLRQSGLELGGRTSVVSGLPPGTVVSQTPKAGVLVSPGTAVAVMVSSGEDVVVVPDVVGVAQSDAAVMLSAAGLRLGDVTPVDDVAEAGTVVGQSPAAGEGAVSGSRVGLRVSTGKVAVPSVAGLPWGEAAEKLSSVGLVAVRRDVAAGVGERAGFVVGQSVPAGRSVAAGSVVYLSVATPTPTPTPTTPAPAPTSTPTPTPTPTAPTPTPTPTPTL